MFRSNCRCTRIKRSRIAGITLIELMIVIAIFTIILNLALPVYSNFTTRSKMAEALEDAMPAKVAVGAACHENPSLDSIDNATIGYSFGATDFVSDVQVSGSCTTALISVLTRNAGQFPAPTLKLTGDHANPASPISWTCSSDNLPDHLLPAACRRG